MGQRSFSNLTVRSSRLNSLPGIKRGRRVVISSLRPLPRLLGAGVAGDRVRAVLGRWSGGRAGLDVQVIIEVKVAR